jgi:pyruvate dehydrogenase E1 component beta subunit
MSVVALEAATQLAASGIEAEIIDLRSLWPIDWDTLCGSARHTGHVLLVEEGQSVCGVGAELAFGLRERIPELRVARLGARRLPVAASPVLEAYTIPGVQAIVNTAHGLLAPAADGRF